MNGYAPHSAVSCVVGKEELDMLNTDFFDLLYWQLEEGRVNKVLENLKADANYQEAAIYQQYESLNLSK